MKLPVIKKTKSGYSTDVDVLEKLKKEDPNFAFATYEEVLETIDFGPIEEGSGRLEVIFRGSQKDYTLLVTVKEAKLGSVSLSWIS